MPYMYPRAIKTSQRTSTEVKFSVFNDVKDLPFHFFCVSWFTESQVLRTWSPNLCRTVIPTPSRWGRAQVTRILFPFSMKLKTFRFTFLCFFVHRWLSFTIMVSELTLYMDPHAIKANQSASTEVIFSVFNEVKGLPFHFFLCCGVRSWPSFTIMVTNRFLTCALAPCVSLF